MKDRFMFFENYLEVAKQFDDRAGEFLIAVAEWTLNEKEPPKEFAPTIKALSISLLYKSRGAPKGNQNASKKDNNSAEISNKNNSDNCFELNSKTNKSKQIKTKKQETETETETESIPSLRSGIPPTISKNSNEFSEMEPPKGRTLDFSFLRTIYEIDLMKKFAEHRRTIKKPIRTQAGLELLAKQLRKLSGDSPPVAAAIVDQSIAGGWQGLFALKVGGSGVVPTKAEIQQQKNRDGWAELIKNNLGGANVKNDQ